jgi:hypothetical protein
MAVTLNPEQERVVNEKLRSGQYRSAEELIWQVLAALREKARGRATEPQSGGGLCRTCLILPTEIAPLSRISPPRNSSTLQ